MKDFELGRLTEGGAKRGDEVNGDGVGAVGPMRAVGAHVFFQVRWWVQ